MLDDRNSMPGRGKNGMMSRESNMSTNMRRGSQGQVARKSVLKEYEKIIPNEHQINEKKLTPLRTKVDGSTLN